MDVPLPSSLLRPPMMSDALQQLWRELNAGYFHERLPPIEIGWSVRLTASAAMFVSRVGPRSKTSAAHDRVIRLSTPLLQQQPHDEIVNTLAHEMIHQWQFDLLKRRPNHGPDFCRKMAEMNGRGLHITIHHTLEDAVQRLSRYAWKCDHCGRAYERQRRTIRPGHHRCGACRGPLTELPVRPMVTVQQPKCLSDRTAAHRAGPVQLDLQFS
jgi:predicted SprT family Zn-dependent metalloprotease